LGATLLRNGGAEGLEADGAEVNFVIVAREADVARGAGAATIGIAHGRLAETELA